MDMWGRRLVPGRKTGGGTAVKEVTCMCGERVVFLDPEVAVKTCPNCGMSVYQEDVEARTLDLARRRSRICLSRRQLVLALFVVAAVAVTLLIVGVSAARQRAFATARQLVRQADIAAAARDYDAAVEGYSRALEIYLLWFAGDQTSDPIRNALERARRKRQAPGQPTGEPADRGMLPISLEDLAQQAYADTPANWSEAFARDYADRKAVIRAKVEERSGEPYRASALTLSYRVFTPAGEEMQISFDPPFFERYRLGSGADCIIQAFLSKMYLDKGAPGGKGRWVLVIDGARSSLVTDGSYLRGLGWKVDDEVENLLASQASLSPAF